MIPLFHCFSRSGFAGLTQFAANGILKAMAKQKQVAIVHFCVYYLLAIPLGYYMTFTRGYGIPGIFNAFGVGICIAAVVFVTLVMVVTDFEQAVEETAVRLKEDVKNVEENQAKGK